MSLFNIQCFVYVCLQDKTLSATLPDADTSSAKSSLDEDENTSSISDAQTMQNKDSTNDTEEADPETNLKPQEETAEANEEITVEVSLKLFSFLNLFFIASMMFGVKCCVFFFPMMDTGCRRCGYLFEP